MFVSCGYTCDHCAGMSHTCFRENTFLSDNAMFFFMHREVGTAKVTGHCGPEMFS